MRRAIHYHAAGILAASLLVGMLSSYADDWPQFRGPHRDGISRETGLLQSWPAKGLTPLWTAEGLGDGYSSAAVSNGRLFTTGMMPDTKEGVLTALDLSGKVLWKARCGPEWDQMYPGSRSTPTVDGDRLYELTGVGRLICMNVADGQTVWLRDLPKEFQGEAPRCGFAEAPLLYGTTVICTPGGKDAALVALDKSTGKTIWTTNGFTDQSAYCSPILIERGGLHIVVTITARHVAGIDADTGAVLWLHPFDTTAEDPNHSVAPVYDSGMIYVTSGHRKGGQMLELADNGRSVTLRWEDTVLDTSHGGLIALGGYVYGSNAKGKWVCLELKTGRVCYESDRVGAGSLTCAGGMLYCYTEKGMLNLVKATPNAYESVSSFKITKGEGQHWAHPVIANGKLYIRHGQCLMAYDIAAK